ncbi:hypothetical protein LTR84_005225 [Exophiala bonariae]|uniref:Polyprenal reductase n=1 Tax=Exophiala bonariae TaxID=1690606 RepID=A0AAV9NRV1_9EURO|nr:hypothetical protein LTR84_005225 [Exophiala bonariae]
MATLNSDSLDSFPSNLGSLLAHKPVFDLVSWGIKAFYLLSAFAILLVRFTPDLRRRFLDYGARAQNASETSESPKGDRRRTIERSSAASQLLDSLAKLTVPHTWFTHFYILSVLCSSLQFHHQIRIHMSQRARVASFCLLLQSSRRLVECLTYNRKSKSRMWIGHYFIGIAFYLFTNITLLLDGVGWADWNHPDIGERFNSMGATEWAFAAFISQAFISQAKSHYYLFTLEKYTLPDELGFKHWIAPHYMAECTFYGSLSVIAAPPDRILNWNLFCAFIFVVVNLSVTAEGTKRWMLSKFPDRRHEIQSRRNVYILR